MSSKAGEKSQPGFEGIIRAKRVERRSAAGTSTVELALLLPLLMLMVFIVADFGRSYYMSITLDHGACAGALYGAQNLGTSGDFAGMNDAAKQEAQNIAPITANSTRFCTCADGSSVNCITGTCPTDPGTVPQVYVQVTTQKTFQPVTPGMSSINLIRVATLRVQ
jgi:Flp pilus assembly protein TadG